MLLYYNCLQFRFFVLKNGNILQIVLIYTYARTRREFVPKTLEDLGVETR